MDASGHIRPVTLTVIMPAFNAAAWIPRSLDKLADALERAPLIEANVVVVDDGSTDDSAGAALRFARMPVEVIRTSNAGRFKARQTGLRAAVGDYVLLLDSRVYMDPGALDFVSQQLVMNPQQVWTAHVKAATQGNPIARFWKAIEHVFWRRYFRNPRTTSFGISEFDYFPKGTTALIAPRQKIMQIVDSYRPSVSDWQKVNDDTAVIRDLATEMPIWISPSYGCTYNARTDLKSFVRHAHHRGSVLIDGYLRKGTRLRMPIFSVLILAPLVAWGAIAFPHLALFGLVSAPVIVSLLFAALGAELRDALVLGTLFWPFSIAYMLGLYRGLFLRIRGNCSA